MALHDLIFVRRERPRLFQNGGGRGQFADIVQIRGDNQTITVIGVQAVHLAHIARLSRQTARMAQSKTRFGVDDEGEHAAQPYHVGGG